MKLIKRYICIAPYRYQSNIKEFNIQTDEITVLFYCVQVDVYDEGSYTCSIQTKQQPKTSQVYLIVQGKRTHINTSSKGKHGNWVSKAHAKQNSCRSSTTNVLCYMFTQFKKYVRCLRVGHVVVQQHTSSRHQCHHHSIIKCWNMSLLGVCKENIWICVVRKRNAVCHKRPPTATEFLVPVQMDLKSTWKAFSSSFPFQRLGSYFSWMETAGKLREEDNHEESERERRCCRIWSKAWRVEFWFSLFLGGLKCLPKVIFWVLRLLLLRWKRML